MSEPSKKPSKRKKPKVRTDLPDDEAILQFFPKRAVDQINEEIEHEPTHRKRPKRKPK